jgi:hypothetical protein
VTFNVQDFTVTNTSTPSTITVTQGSCNTGSVAVASLGGFSGLVQLTPSPSAGINASLTPTSIAASGSSILKVCAPASTPTGTNYNVTVTGTSGTLSHSVVVPVTVAPLTAGCPDNTTTACADPSFSQMLWTHRLSLSKTGGVQTWRFGVQNPNNDTIYVNVQITVTDGTGVNGFTLNSGVITLSASKNLVNITVSQTIPAADLGDTFTWNAVIQWGTSPTDLSNTSTLNNGVPTSGSFTVLA